MVEWIVVSAGAVVALGVVLAAIFREPRVTPEASGAEVGGAPGSSGEELENGGGDGSGVLDR